MYIDFFCDLCYNIYVKAVEVLLAAIRRKNMSLTPYRKIAKAALQNWGDESSGWVGWSKEDAEKAVKTESGQMLEKRVGALDSIRSSVIAIGQALGYSQAKSERLLNSVTKQENVNVLPEDLAVFVEAGQDFEKAQKGKSKEDIILDALATIHDGWTRDNSKKFTDPKRSGKKYQHFPIELIGWKEATADLLFLEPILNYLGVEVDKAKLQARYNERVAKFLDNNDLVDSYGLDKNALAGKIMQGSKFYPAFDDKNLVTDQKEALVIAGQVENVVSKEALDMLKGDSKD